MVKKDLAVCIRAVDYSETSQIVTFFTRSTGKISAIAKGSKRPKSAFDGPIELFSNGEIVFYDSSKEKLATLTEFQQQPNLAHLGSDYFALTCSQFAAELIDRLTEDCDPHPELFDNFLQFLKNTKDANAEAGYLDLLILFQLALLNEIGMQPILNACANCKTRYQTRDTRHDFYFSHSVNGLICRDCEGSFPDKIKLSADAAACMANLKLIDRAQKKTLAEIEKILIDHFTEILHRPPKMAKYIAGLFDL